MKIIIRRKLKLFKKILGLAEKEKSFNSTQIIFK